MCVCVLVYFISPPTSSSISFLWIKIEFTEVWYNSPSSLSNGFLVWEKICFTNLGRKKCFPNRSSRGVMWDVGTWHCGHTQAECVSLVPWEECFGNLTHFVMPNLQHPMCSLEPTIKQLVTTLSLSLSLSQFDLLYSCMA